MNRLAYFSLPAVLLLAGCASVSVRPEQTAETPMPRGLPPRQLVVCPFDFATAKVKADRDGEELAAFQAKVTNDLNGDLLRSLAPLGIPAQMAIAVPPPSSALQPVWLIRGQFKTVDQGSRALRAFIGFGTGRTTLETEVQVYDLSVSAQTPLLTFETTGGSGAEPGAILSGNPIGLALGAGGKAASTGVSEDAKRTARMIAAYVSTALADRGYIAPEKAREAKLVKTDSNSNLVGVGF